MLHLNSRDLRAASSMGAASPAAVTDAAAPATNPAWNQLNGASLPVGVVAVAGGFLANHAGLAVGGVAAAAGGLASKELNKRGHGKLAKAATAAGYVGLLFGIAKAWK